MSKYVQGTGVLLTLVAILLVSCEAGYYARRQQFQMSTHQSYYQNRNANQQLQVKPYYQNRDANQQFYYQNRDANQQHYYQNRDASQQGYYQNRDAHQQGNYYQSRDNLANQQLWYLDALNQQFEAPDPSCLLSIHSPSKTFVICVKTDEICTNQTVSACSPSATRCQQIGKDDQYIKEFKRQHSEVYAMECVETTGQHCLYTDVAFDTCSQAKEMQEKVCIKLSDGTERCSKVDELVKAAEK